MKSRKGDKNSKMNRMNKINKMDRLDRLTKDELLNRLLVENAILREWTSESLSTLNDLRIKVLDHVQKVDRKIIILSDLLTDVVLKYESNSYQMSFDDVNRRRRDLKTYWVKLLSPYNSVDKLNNKPKFNYKYGLANTPLKLREKRIKSIVECISCSPNLESLYNVITSMLKDFDNSTKIGLNTLNQFVEVQTNLLIDIIPYTASHQTNRMKTRGEELLEDTQCVYNKNKDVFLRTPLNKNLNVKQQKIATNSALRALKNKITPSSSDDSSHIDSTLVSSPSIIISSCDNTPINNCRTNYKSSSFSTSPNRKLKVKLSPYLYKTPSFIKIIDKMKFSINNKKSKTKSKSKSKSKTKPKEDNINYNEIINKQDELIHSLVNTIGNINKPYNNVINNNKEKTIRFSDNNNNNYNNNENESSNIQDEELVLLNKLKTLTSKNNKNRKNIIDNKKIEHNQPENLFDDYINIKSDMENNISKNKNYNIDINNKKKNNDNIDMSWLSKIESLLTDKDTNHNSNISLNYNERLINNYNKENREYSPITESSNDISLGNSSLTGTIIESSVDSPTVILKKLLSRI